MEGKMSEKMLRGKPRQYSLPKSESRRNFLRTGITGVTSGLIYILFPPKLAASIDQTLHRQILNRPRKLRSIGSRIRFRKKRHHSHHAPRFKIRRYGQTNPFGPKLRDSFQLNRRTKIIHYINRDGWSSERVGWQPQNLEPIDRRHVISLLTKMVDPKVDEIRVHLSQVGPIAERLALEQAWKGNIEKAIEVLWSVIRLHTDSERLSSYRLYDLLAGLAHRSSPNQFGTPKPIEELVEHVQKHWRYNKILNARCQKWINPPSTWLTRWRSKELVWRLSEI